MGAERGPSREAVEWAKNKNQPEIPDGEEWIIDMARKSDAFAFDAGREAAMARTCHCAIGWDEKPTDLRKFCWSCGGTLRVVAAQDRG